MGKNIKIKYFNDKLEKLTYIDGKSDWIDLRSAEDIDLKQGEFKLGPLGVAMEIPEGYEGQVRPRSGLALKSGITVLNSPGTIDADYRGQVCVILINLSDKPFIINSGDRIAQLVIARCEQAQTIQVESLSETERGAGGFGHTGTK